MRSRQGNPSGKRQDDRETQSMTALFDRYFSGHARPNKKASSLAEEERLIRDGLKPGFARRKVAKVKRADVDVSQRLVGQSASGRPVARAALEGVQPRRDVGLAARGLEPLPSRQEIRRDEAQAVSLAEGTDPIGRGVADRRAQRSACPARGEGVRDEVKRMPIWAVAGHADRPLSPPTESWEKNKM